MGETAVNHAFVNGTIDTGIAGQLTDRLFVSDGVIQPWPQQLPDDVEVTDLEGGQLRPGFADGHTHPFLAGKESIGPQIRRLTSVPAIKDAVEKWAYEHPEAEWVVGGSYDATTVPGGLFDARWLDPINRPVALRAWDYHTLWCNSRALELAGITRETPDPPFGKIVRRDDGTPSGTLLEAAASLVLDLVPVEPFESQIEILRSATETLASHGIVWMQEAWAETSELSAWRTAAQRGDLAVDVDLAVRADPQRWPEQIAEIVAERDRCEGIPGLSMDTVKFFVDGIIENHTASMLEDYADSCSRGLPNWSDDALSATLIDVHHAGFDIHLHAIGDAGVRSALDAVSNLRKQDLEGKCRITLAHAQVVHPDDLGRFAELGVVVCFQPLWARPDEVMLSLTLPRLGSGRERQYQIGSVLRSGASVTFGSDWPCGAPSVLEGIATAATRQNPDGLPLEGWQPEERITVREALTAASSAIYLQSRRGEDRGSLKPGNKADLVWLSKDPLSCSPAEITSIEVLGTWCRGKRTYTRRGL